MERLGRYELLRRIGRGGAGTVYEAVLVGPGGLRKPVALEVLPPGAGTLRREARLLDDGARRQGQVGGEAAALAQLERAVPAAVRLGDLVGARAGGLGVRAGRRGVWLATALAHRAVVRWRSGDAEGAHADLDAAERLGIVQNSMLARGLADARRVLGR